jgi:hypothetical protein
MEEISLTFGKVTFDYAKKCFYAQNNKEGDQPAVRLWPANMECLSKQLPTIMMQAREAETNIRNALEQQSALLKEGESIDHLLSKTKDKLLNTFTISEWDEGKFAVKVETSQFSSEVFVWLQFRYHHDDDPEGKMRTRRGQVRLDVNKDNISELQKFAERCIIQHKLNKLSK